MNAPLPFFSNERTRPHGIGGTDIGAVLGLSPYKTALELWADLVGNEVSTFRDQLHLRFGQHNESFIAREFERATGLQTCEHQGTLFHREHGFMFGHVDRFLVKHPGELPVVDGVVVVVDTEVFFPFLPATTVVVVVAGVMVVVVSPETVGTAI